MPDTPPQGLESFVGRFAGPGPFWLWLGVLVGVGIIVFAREAVQTLLMLLSSDPHQLTPLDVLVQVIVFSPLALFWLWTFGSGVEAAGGALFGFGYVASTVLSSLLATRVRQRY